MALAAHVIPVIAATGGSVIAMSRQVSIPVWLEMLAVVVSSISGVLCARENRLDFMGAIGLAVAVGLGGGLLRDVILQRGSVYMLDQPLALPVAIITATATFIFPDLAQKPDRLIAALDIFSVGLYAAVGADKAMVYDLSPLVCIMMGFLTAVGGGMLRDVFLGRTPTIFQRGNLYAFAAIAGATTYFVGVWALGIQKIVALVLCVTVTIALRWASITFNILSPTEIDLRRMARSGKVIGSKALETVAIRTKRRNERRSDGDSAQEEGREAAVGRRVHARPKADVRAAARVRKREFWRRNSSR